MPPKGGRKHPQQEFLQVDTTNILFICGGAFTGLEDIIENRVGQKQMGFGAEITLEEREEYLGVPQGRPARRLHEYGMIPKFVGRLPVIAPLAPADRRIAGRILIEPKNALVKQYQKLFDMDGVELEFTARRAARGRQAALRTKSGCARGLRSILESGPARDHVRDSDQSVR